MVLGDASLGLTEELCEGTYGALYDVVWENDECKVSMTTALLGYSMRWTLNADYTGSFASTSSGATTTASGTWSTSGTTLTLTSEDPNDDALVGTYSIEGSTLDFSYADATTGYAQTFVFTKQ